MSALAPGSLRLQLGGLDQPRLAFLAQTEALALDPTNLRRATERLLQSLPRSVRYILPGHCSLQSEPGPNRGAVGLIRRGSDNSAPHGSPGGQ
jgi:hypothetical protein